MFPGSMFPSSLFPPSMFPGSRESSPPPPDPGRIDYATLLLLVGPAPSTPYIARIDYATLLLLASPPASTASPTILVIDAEIANWLESTLDVEVYPLAIPQGTNDYPVMVYTVVDGDSLYSLNGPAGLAYVRYQLDSYSRVYSEAATLAERLRLALVALTKQILKAGGSAQVGAATVRWVEVHRAVNGYDPTGTGEDNQGMYRRMSEVTFHFAEDVSGLS
jgi:hypothetical protein